MHLAQLIFQHNDLVSNVEDCLNKYVARHLFLRLARQGRISTFGFAQDDWSAMAKTSPASLKVQVPSNSESFHLWCDDFRTANVLVDPQATTDKIAAVIDWEFMYAASTQFKLDSP
jgi:hypothetical protein